MATTRKSYTAKQLHTKSLKELTAICKRTRASFRGLNQAQIIENILARQQGKKSPNAGKVSLPFRQAMELERDITPQIRYFAFLYATTVHNKTNKQWAKFFKVSPTTVFNWLQWPQVKELILKFQENREMRITEMFQRHEEALLLELVKMGKDPKNSEVKRKAIVDFLGYAGRKDINRARVIVGQIQGQGQSQGQAQSNSVEAMSDDDLQRELDELDHHLDK